MRIGRPGNAGEIATEGDVFRAAPDDPERAGAANRSDRGSLPRLPDAEDHRQLAAPNRRARTAAALEQRCGRHSGKDQKQRRYGQHEPAPPPHPPTPRARLQLMEACLEERRREFRPRLDRPVELAEDANRILAHGGPFAYASRKPTRPRASSDSTASTLRPKTAATSGTDSPSAWRSTSAVRWAGGTAASAPSARPSVSVGSAVTSGSRMAPS